MRKWFTPSSPLGLSPARKAVSYCLLIFWSVIVLFPFYWLLTTAFKLPIDVSSGPKYLPFLDFHPSLNAWHEMRDFIPRPYRNTLVVGAREFASCPLHRLVRGICAATLQVPAENWDGGGLHSVRFVGGGSCRVRRGVLVGGRADRRRPLSGRVGHDRQTLQSSIGERRHRLLADRPADAATGGGHTADLHDVPAARSARHAVGVDHRLYRDEPPAGGLVHARLFPVDPDGARGERIHRRRFPASGRPENRSATVRPGPCRHVPDRSDIRLERADLRHLPDARRFADDAGAGGGTERDAAARNGGTSRCSCC